MSYETRILKRKRRASIFVLTLRAIDQGIKSLVLGGVMELQRWWCYENEEDDDFLPIKRAFDFFSKKGKPH